MNTTRKSNDDGGGTNNNSPEIREQMESMTLDDDYDEKMAQQQQQLHGKLRKEITFKFRVKFYTKWGENVVVCGKSQAMGEYDATKGAWMSCEHIVLNAVKKKTKKTKNNADEKEEEESFEDDEEDSGEEDEGEEEREGGDELLWTATKTMRWDEPLEYRYAVVDSHGSVILWDAPIRIAKLERQTSRALTGNGENVVEFTDTFERKNHAETHAAAVVKPQPCEFLRSGILSGKKNDANGDASLRVVVLRFQVKAMRMPSKRPGSKVSVRVTGSCQSLGKWDRSRAMRMGNDESFEVLSPASSDASEHTVNDRNNTSSSNDNNNGYCWHLEVACASSELPVRYKYEIWDDDIEQVIESEECKRTIGIDWDLKKRQFDEELHRKNRNDNNNNNNNNRKGGEIEGTSTEINDDGEEDAEKTPTRHRATPTKKKTSTSSSYEPPKCIVASDGHFAHAKAFRCAGVAVPVFSLRSSKSLGCGEFSDLKLMADFCRESGFRILR